MILHIKFLKGLDKDTEKKITHIWRRWGTPQNFLLEFIDELWKTRKIRILKKRKKITWDIIIIHMCTKNHHHMRYSSWDTEWGNFFLSFWAIFYPLSPPSHPNNSENQNFEKMKKASGALRKYVGSRWKTKRKNQWRFVVWRHTIGNSLEESTCNDAEMNRPVGRMDGVEIRRICTFFFAHESNINQTFAFKVFEDFFSWYLSLSLDF